MDLPHATIQAPARNLSKPVVKHIVLEDGDPYWYTDAFVNPDPASPVAAIVVETRVFRSNGSYRFVFLVGREKGEDAIRAMLSDANKPNEEGRPLFLDERPEWQSKFIEQGVMHSNDPYHAHEIISFARNDEGAHVNEQDAHALMNDLNFLRDSPLISEDPAVRHAMLEAMGSKYMAMHEVVRDTTEISRGS